jgi:hypothetical protein
MFIGATRKPRQYDIDTDLIEDLFLYMQSEEKIVRNYENDFLPNVARKAKSGKLDKSKLPKLFEYLYKNHLPTIKRYYTDIKLNPAERLALGKMWADQAIDDINDGYREFDPVYKILKGKKIEGIKMFK